jgi:hypothetical protein
VETRVTSGHAGLYIWAVDILALDIATQLGWARGPLGADVPEFGTVRLGKKGASNPYRYAAALRWTVEAMANDQPDILAIESPISIRGFTSQQTARLLFGLPACIMGMAIECGVRDLREHDVRDVRNLFIGRKNLSTDAAKDAVVRRCQQLGWRVPDHNAADACALWAHQCAQIRPGPMLQRLSQVGVCC